MYFFKGFDMALFHLLQPDNGRIPLVSLIDWLNLLLEDLIWHIVGPTYSHVVGVVAKVDFWMRFFDLDWPEVDVSALLAFLDVPSSLEASLALSSGRIFLGRRWAPAPCHYLSVGWFFFPQVSHGWYVWRGGFLPLFSFTSFFFFKFW